MSKEISKYIGVTGRVKTYLDNPEKGTAPVSCTVYKVVKGKSIFNCIKYVDIALRGGAGINVILDEFQSKPPQQKAFYFTLDVNHPEYPSIPNELKPLYFDFSEENHLANPVVINVNDSMEETVEIGGVTYYSIQASWKEMIDLLEEGYTPIINLSKLRAKGTVNKVGLEASGPLSFLTIYQAILNHVNKRDILSFMQMLGQLNEVLRRGGSYKNGIVTFSLHYTHPDIIKYLNIPLPELPGSAKKGIRIDEGLKDNKRVKFLVVERVNDKSLRLEKVVYQYADNQYSVGKSLNTLLKDILSKYPKETKYKELYSNVCVEVILPSRGTCLLLHENLGQIGDISEIVPAFEEGMKLLIELFTSWKNDVRNVSHQYLSNEEDRQVGLGVFGLANLLAHLGISFKKHVLALEAYLNDGFYPANSPEWKLAEQLYKGYHAAAKIAKEARLERAFVIAPTQSCAYRYTDLEGNTTCKNIYPPLDVRVRRTSYTVSDLAKWYFHGDVETIEDVVEVEGPQFLSRLIRVWQRLMNSTGLAHSISHDLYYKIDENWLDSFIDNPDDITTYYQFYDKIDQSYLNKGNTNVPNAKPVAESIKGFCSMDAGCESCAE